MVTQPATITCRDGKRAGHRNVYRWIQSQQQKYVEMDTEPSAKPVAVILFSYSGTSSVQFYISPSVGTFLSI
jgi:hypothetical protein